MIEFKVGDIVKSHENNIYRYEVLAVHTESITVKTIGSTEVYHGQDKELFEIVKRSV